MVVLALLACAACFDGAGVVVGGSDGAPSGFADPAADPYSPGVPAEGGGDGGAGQAPGGGDGAVGGFPGAAGQGPAPDVLTRPDGRCVSDLEYFQMKISLPLLEKTCINCHSPQGVARSTKLVLRPPGTDNFLRQNFELLRTVAAYHLDGRSILELKPTEQVSHYGGQVIVPGSVEHDDLVQLVRRFAQPSPCEPNDHATLRDKLILSDLPATLRRAKLQLNAALPSAAELAQVNQGGEQGLRDAVAGMLDEQRFYEVLKMWFNERFHTDKYLGGTRALDLLDRDRFPGARARNGLDAEGQRIMNDAVAQAPLELIAYVVRNDLPFTEVLTADYMVVNPFSARAFGVDGDLEFDDTDDPYEFRAARAGDYPHAGILTSPMLLNRYPTTETNKNRKRARYLWEFFLATDVLKAGERPVDVSTIEDHNPTMNTPACAMCHGFIDPIAGAYQNWDEMGRYRPPEAGWHRDMRPPGWPGDPMPIGAKTTALSWLADRIVADERFALAAVRTVYEGLVGRQLVTYPPNPDAEHFIARLEFYNMEQEFVHELAKKLIGAGYRLKAVIPDIVLSPFYRAEGANGLAVHEIRAVQELGTSTLLWPELLHSRIEAVTGFPWRRRAGDPDPLLSREEFRFFYGGIDSDQVTVRVTTPNGLMANIGLRMGLEMGCLLPPREFGRAAGQRRLFPHVEPDLIPEDETGMVLDRNAQAILQNIRHLHAILLGEQLEPGHPQLRMTWQLFVETWREGQGALRTGTVPAELPEHCRFTEDPLTGEAIPAEEQVIEDPDYTLRAWGAVLAYMLSDWRFLYQ